MKHNRTFFAATGIPSLFLIFSVLCLAVLSLLTLGKSRDELQASNFAVQQTDLYYKTCEKATGTVTAIQKQLTSDYNQVSDPDAYFSLAGQIPDEIDGLAYDSSANVISFSEALSDTQKLSVKLKVLYPSSDTEPFIEILQWKTDNTASWTPDTHQPVYKGAQSLQMNKHWNFLQLPQTSMRLISLLLPVVRCPLKWTVILLILENV